MTVVEAFWKWLLAKLPCPVCVRFVSTGKTPSLHHIAEGSGIRSTFGMCPLCEPHHQGEHGLHGMGPKAFIALYRPPGDSEFGLLIWMLEDLAAYLRHWLRRLGVKGDMP